MTSNREIRGVVLLGVIFIAAAYLSERFQDGIAEYLDFGHWGMAVYALAGILATVIVPLTAVPLIPAAVVLWGPWVTALLNITGWMAGSMIAFAVARRWGKSFVERFVNFEKVSRYEKALGERNLFWNVIFLRILVPADILSYALGIFTRMSAGKYALATLVGITPLALVLPHLAQISLRYQIIAGAILVAMLYFGYNRIKKMK
jgi:uncharacterized membrane protein YdjX (TVP38/TMEM64 family)